MRILLLIYYFVVFQAVTLFAQDVMPVAAPNFDKFKVIFISGFTKYLEWPATAKKGNFVIGVLGDSPVFSELIEMAKKQNTRNEGNPQYQPMLIKKFSVAESVQDCHIVYVPEQESAKIQKLSKHFEGRQTIIITDKPGMLEKGSGINFIIQNNKQAFEIDQTTIKSRGISVSSQLAKLAIKVI